MSTKGPIGTILANLLSSSIKKTG